MSDPGTRILEILKTSTQDLIRPPEVASGSDAEEPRAIQSDKCRIHQTVPALKTLLPRQVPYLKVRSVIHGLLLVALAAAATPMVVRWILPVVLRVVVDILADVILVVAGLILLQVLEVGANFRSSGRCPTQTGV